MYVENKFYMDQETNEATAVLKGMLGMSISAPSNAAASPSAVTTQPTPLSSPEEASKVKKRNNKNKNKKKKNDDISKTPPSKPDRGGSAEKGKNPNSKSKKKNQQRKKKETSENYAWSAFQSSPDASKLPIPAFSSPVQEKKLISIETTTSATKSFNETLVHTLTVQEVESAVVDDTRDVASEEGSPAKEPEEEVVKDEESSAPTETSSTGVNLAVLAAKPPAGALEETPQVNVRPPHGSPLAFRTPPPPPPPHHLPLQFPLLPPQHQQLPPPPPYSSYPPPGYVTIHVQVPPILMQPGRQMVVTSPAGYPVQIAVPEGIPPGVIIPVHVPVGPPMHMMPPPPAHHIPPPFHHHPHHPPTGNSPGQGGGYYYNGNNPTVR